MGTEGFKRKLAAIFSADVAGYSRLMGEDESATVRTVATYKRVIADLIQQHRGRVVDSPGDNILAEFVSVVDAVQCAVSVQKEIQARNVELPENRRMRFRIGINLGDVIEEEDRIYGDGVNIAARLESLADPGGICISKTAFDHIETKLPFGYECLGEQSVKNIAKPICVYKVLMDARVTVKDQAQVKPKEGAKRRPMIIALLGVLLMAVGATALWQFAFPPTPPPVEKASKERMAFPLPDKPSIAVMPFVNMTGEQTQDFFCDGLSESLITALSKMPQLLVIGRESTFSYKGKGAKIRQVSEELGVQYVLEGSVQKAGDRVRVTAELLDALKGYQLWSERYDRNVRDIFDLQDEITMKILTELRVAITDGGAARIHAKGTNNLQAYLKLLEGNGYLNQGTKEAQAEAERLYREAMDLDPKYPMPYVGLAYALYIDVLMGASESPNETLSNAMKSAQKAVELDSSLADAQAVVCNIFVGTRQYDEAIEAGELAVTLGPNNSMALGSLGNCLIYTGRSEEALPLTRQAIRLNPFRSGPYRLFAHACRETGRYEEGIIALKKFLQIAPNDMTVRVILVSLYMYAGREDEARATVAEIQRIAPNFSVERLAKASPWKDGATRDRFIDSLRRAGLK
jgi:adenylate cyclase